MPSHISLKAPRKIWRARRISVKSSKKKKKSLKLNYAVYIWQVLNELFPYIEITPKGMEILNVFLNYIFERIAIEASKQAQCNGESKIDTIEIQYAVLHVFQRGDLAMHSMWAGLTALRKYCTPQDKWKYKLDLFFGPFQGHTHVKEQMSWTVCTRTEYKRKQPQQKTQIKDNSHTSHTPIFHEILFLLCGNKIPTGCNRWFLLQILLLAQRVSGTTMPVITPYRQL